ncbi:asparagine synthase (glutamine-hydrolyzing) [Paenibacillus sp. FSL A5-0031]|uniref:asparagine synthase (glutamine-hydrolyzing) n=1 Tax=Paenibacillus sp. FSL A5-0031 TaxID=1920420 RepID=UPI00096F67B1|nr:asparagine synthase (glutamine-hydrolyzing) [Paenibacillus sp. FSL A5-0031]OME75919.1 asparagine synthase (glutamine-hydrolyzing) [Paenibacillus sp. FSL A5-0031]
MCGFVGYTQTRTNFKHNNNIIEAMMDTIVHRGPDSHGIYSDEDVAFGFRRLKIIDLTDVASQPMTNEDENCILVFNGEIYNYKELREELMEKGHHFKSQTDSEVIIHGYEEYGEQIISKLRGMFSIAIWDKRNGRLLLARDMFGIKPLYYTQNTSNETMIFGSEIKSFLKHPYFRKELNKQALKPYLTFQYSVLDETFFKGVYKLQPGHMLVHENNKIKIHSYWDANYSAVEDSLEKYVEEINRTVSESVESHKISDVAVGSYLSGGVDSSYITALLKPDKTFTVGFKDYDGNFNETDLAEDLSNRLHIENHKRLVTADECFQALPKIQYHMDEPQSNLSSLPLYFLAELASQHVTVVLSGEGADEIFGGYDWYAPTPIMEKYQIIPYTVRRAVSKIATMLPRHRISNFLVKGGQRVEETFIGHAKVFEEADAIGILKDEYRDGPSVQSITSNVYDKVQGKDDLTKKQYLDLKLWMPGDILLKADKMSMAHSLEMRVPFLDKKVMNLAMKIPSQMRVRSQKTKYAFRAAAKQVLPEEWAKRPKVGFPVPIRYWLREKKYYDMVKESFSSDSAKQFFYTEKLIGYLDAHFLGKQNHARYIWTVYVFLVWYQTFFEE